MRKHDQRKTKGFFYLEPWMEIIGVIHEITVDEQYFYLTVDDKVLPFRKDAKEALHIQDKVSNLIGKSIAIIKTDIPDKPILIRLGYQG